ncbi:MAG: hypothetical protein V8S08_08250 [Lachnoclostridium sp.]
MVNLFTGPKGNGKTIEMIELANQQAQKACKMKTLDLLKNSHREHEKCLDLIFA